MIGIVSHALLAYVKVAKTLFQRVIVVCLRIHPERTVVYIYYDNERFMMDELDQWRMHAIIIISRVFDVQNDM
jgi:hypothetical protein